MHQGSYSYEANTGRTTMTWGGMPEQIFYIAVYGQADPPGATTYFLSLYLDPDMNVLSMRYRAMPDSLAPEPFCQ